MATLVKQARAEFPNTLLFDAGDTIQGTALADYQALVKPVGCDEELAMYRAMDALGYDGGTIGNHEFNYGLPFLAQVTGRAMNVDGVEARRCKGPRIRSCCRTYSARATTSRSIAPYAVVDEDAEDRRRRRARDRSADPHRHHRLHAAADHAMGQAQSRRQGLHERAWSKRRANFVPQLRAQNVDLVIAISHGGIDASPYGTTMENANWYLAERARHRRAAARPLARGVPRPGQREVALSANLPDVDNAARTSSTASPR